MRFHRPILMLLLAAGICACGTEGEAVRDSTEPAVEALRLSDRTVVLTCLEANVTAVRTADGILLIDTGRSPTLMRHILRRIESELGPSPVRVVVNTHGHWDHTSGNQVLSGAVLIGHEECPEYMRQFPASTASNMWYQRSLLAALRESRAGPEESPAERKGTAGVLRAREVLLEDLERVYEVTPPSRLFRDSLSMKLGDVTLNLYHTGENHTSHDVIVHVPEEHLLVTGDLFMSPGSLGFAVNGVTEISRVIAVLDQALEEDPRVDFIVPGHGEVMGGEDLAAIRRTLEDGEKTMEGEPSTAALLKASIESLGVARALDRYQQGLLDAPGRAPVSEEEFDVLGYRLLGRGQVREAVAVLEVAVAAHPGSALLHDSLAEAYLKHGSREASKASYERSLELNPYNRNAAEMLRILAGGS